MTRIIVELTEPWTERLIERARSGAPDWPGLADIAARLPMPGLARVLHDFGQPGSAPISERPIGEQVASSSGFQKRGSQRAPTLVGFYALDVGALPQPDRERLREALNALEGEIESAEFEPEYRGARDPHTTSAPSYRPYQPYLDVLRVDEVEPVVNSRNIGFGVLDVGWNLDHEALRHLGRPPLFPRDLENTGVPNADDHGTAVLGIIAGGARIRGIATKAQLKALLFPLKGQSVAATIQEFLEDEKNDRLNFGDVLLIEVEQYFPDRRGSGLPLEVDPATFRAIQIAVALGIVVVEVAGNGNTEGARDGWNLDLVARDGALAPAWHPRSKKEEGIPDSGAILVSGCVPPALASADSVVPDKHLNFGSRIDCYGWGSLVLTSGPKDSPPYGFDRAGPDKRLWYDANFNGTSAAAAMIAGVVLVIQQMAIEEPLLGYPLSPAQLRSVLRASSCGCPVRRNGNHAGCVPDLVKIRQQLKALPRLLIRAFDTDDGTQRALVTPHSESPDIFHCRAPSTDPARDNDVLIVPGEESWIYAGVMNIGDGPSDDVRAMAYWSVRNPEAYAQVVWHELDVSEPVAVTAGSSPTFVGPILLRVPLNVGASSGRIDVVVAAGGELDPRPLVPPMRQARKSGWSRAEVQGFLQLNPNVAMRSFGIAPRAS